MRYLNDSAHSVRGLIAAVLDDTALNPDSPISPEMPFDVRTAWPWVVFVGLVMLANAVQRRRKYARLPPGPTPLPIVGNILDFPRTHLGREFAAMSKKFGTLSCP